MRSQAILNTLAAMNTFKVPTKTAGVNANGQPRFMKIATHDRGRALLYSTDPGDLF